MQQCAQVLSIYLIVLLSQLSLTILELMFLMAAVQIVVTIWLALLSRVLFEFFSKLKILYAYLLVFFLFIEALATLS